MYVETRISNEPGLSKSVHEISSLLDTVNCKYI